MATSKLALNDGLFDDEQLRKVERRYRRKAGLEWDNDKTIEEMCVTERQIFQHCPDVDRCPKCGGAMISYASQRRSGDEGCASVTRCGKCGLEVNGKSIFN